MSSDLLGKDKAPFIVGVFFSIVAWSVNGLISEITERKVVQYSTNKLEGVTTSRFVVSVPLIPPGAELELRAQFPKGDPNPKFEAYYYLASNSEKAIDADMRIILADTFEA